MYFCPQSSATCPECSLRLKAWSYIVCVFVCIMLFYLALRHLCTLLHLPVATYHGEMHQLIFLRQGGVFKTF